MNDWHRTLFDHYAAHYRAMEKRERLPDDLERLKRDRLPRWIDETPRTARVLDAGCAEGHWLEALRRVGFTNLTGGTSLHSFWRWPGGGSGQTRG